MVKLDKDAIKAIVEAVEAANTTSEATDSLGGHFQRSEAPPSPSTTPAAPPTTPLLRRAVPNGEVHPATNGGSIEAEHDEDVNDADRLDKDVYIADRHVNGHAADAFPELEDGDARLSINGVSDHCDGGNAVVNGEGGHESNADDILPPMIAVERQSGEEKSPENGLHSQTPPETPENDEWSPEPAEESGETTTLCLARLGGDKAPEGEGQEVRESRATTSEATDSSLECASSPPPLCLPAPPPTPAAVQITNVTILVNGVDIDTFESGGGNGADVEPLDNDVAAKEDEEGDDDDDDDLELDVELAAQPLPPVPPTRRDSLVLKSYEESVQQ